MKKRILAMGLLLALLAFGMAQGLQTPLAHASGWTCANDPVLGPYGPYSNGHGSIYVNLEGQDCTNFSTDGVHWSVYGTQCIYNVGCLSPSQVGYLFVEQGLDRCRSTDAWTQEMTTGNDNESVGQSVTATGVFLDCGSGQGIDHTYNVLSTHEFSWDPNDSNHGGSFCGYPPNNNMSTNTSGC